MVDFFEEVAVDAFVDLAGDAVGIDEEDGDRPDQRPWRHAGKGR